jgi:hypothetical protein
MTEKKAGRINEQNIQVPGTGISKACRKKFLLFTSRILIGSLQKSLRMDIFGFLCLGANHHLLLGGRTHMHIFFRGRPFFGRESWSANTSAEKKPQPSSFFFYAQCHHHGNNNTQRTPLVSHQQSQRQEMLREIF